MSPTLHPSSPRSAALRSAACRPFNGGTALLLAAVLLPACGGGSSSSSGLDIHTSTHAASPDVDPILAGRWLVYFASESSTGTGAGTDLNGDTTPDDVVPVVVNIRDDSVTVSGVASTHAAIRGDDVYFVVDEAADGVDWSMADGMADIVLLHWSETLGGPAFVDVLDADASDLTGDLPLIAVANDKLFYTAKTSSLMGDETSLRFVNGAMPRTPTAVLNQDMAGTLEPHLLGVDEGLLFLTLDENEEGTNLNDDGTDMDTTDSDVLALLDVRDPAVPRVANVGLAIETSVFRAHSTGTDDWLVAFLVDEGDQGGEDLDSPVLFMGITDWLPPGCSATPDGDADDEVLFYLEYQDFLNSGAMPVNTGLSGQDRILAMDGYVATIVDEDDAGCDLDGDGGTTDRVLRWMGVGSPIVPPPPATEYHALALLIDDSMGVARLGPNFVCVVDEASDGMGGTDHNGDGNKDAHLLARIDPSSETSWTFLHATPSSSGTIPFYAGVEWMAARPSGVFLPIAFEESVIQPGDTMPETRNFTCSGAYDDMDATDAIPVWVTLSGTSLLLPGVGLALTDGNPGLRLTSTQIFFRVSESEHGVDLNLDTDKNDSIVVRNPLFACNSEIVGVGSDVPGPAVYTDGAEGAAFFADESQAGTDLNGDGDMPMGELAVRWFQF